MSKHSRPFTKRFIDALPRPTARTFYWEGGDGAVKGFGCKVEPTGRKVFVFQYDDASGRTRRITVGSYGAMTVDQAREQAKQQAAAVAKARTDPGALDPARAREEARTRAQTATDTPLMAELFDAFVADRVRRQSDATTISEYRRILGVVAAKVGASKGEPRPGVLRVAFGAKRATSITKRDIREFHEKHAPTPAMANRYVVLLSAVFNFASRNDLVAAPNPCENVELYELKPRRQSLRDEGYDTLGAALDAGETVGLLTAPTRKARRSGMSAKRRARLTGRKRAPYSPKAPKPSAKNPYAIAMLRFLAVSGWRSEEAESLRWEFIDSVRGVAILPDTKTDRSVRPLGREALAVLSTMQAKANYPTDSPFVFPGAKANTALTEIKHVWADVRHAAGLTITKHGLRHAFITTGRWLGYGDHVIARLVGHENSASQTSRYGDVPDQLVRAAADKIAAYIAQRLRGVPASELTETAA